MNLGTCRSLSPELLFATMSGLLAGLGLCGAFDHTIQVGSTPMSAFPEISKIQYEGPESKNPLAFHWYNPDEVIEGKTMKEHMRFSVVYWHTFRGNGSDPFGMPTMQRPWEDGSDSVENAKNRVRVAFEFMEKLDAPYYAFHDLDVRPEGSSLAESNGNFDAIVDVLKEEQSRTGIQLLWGTANMFSHPRYMHGAATSCNADVYAYAASAVKKCIEVTHYLGGENYVFWGGREGYQNLYNTDMKRELDHLGAFFHMACDFADKIGFKGTFLIEPKPKEPTKHQYDSDAAACINFLRAYDLTERFKLNIETNHATLAGHTMMHELDYAGGQGATRLDRRQHGRPFARLGHGPVSDRHLSDDSGHADAAQARRRGTRWCELRRQGAPRELRADRSLPRSHRRYGCVRSRVEDRRRNSR